MKASRAKAPHSTSNLSGGHALAESSDSSYNGPVSLEHDAPHFTPEQRDEILSLANRLQARHEGSVGADELVRVAEEAGIDPRFVQEAALRLGQKSRPLPRSLGVAFGLFVLQAGFFVFIQNLSIGGGRSVSAFEVSFAIAMAFFLALWAARERRVRWFTPLVALSVWTALFLAATGLSYLSGVHQSWILQTALVFGFAQAVAAMFGAVAAAGVESLDRAPQEHGRFDRA